LKFCPKRSKIESFTELGHLSAGKGSIREGNRLHYLYSYWNRDFDRDWIRARLAAGVAEKTLDDYIVVRGKLDDLNVLTYNNIKFVSLIELKTTNKKYMWSREIQAAITQLQLYLWLYNDILDALGFPLWKRSYLLIYSQKTKMLLRRIPVEYDPHIEDFIRSAVNQFLGLERMEIPPLRYCHLCPHPIKTNCSWYAMRMSNTNILDNQGVI
jgi:hypothetical protein